MCDMTLSDKNTCVSVNLYDIVEVCISIVQEGGEQRASHRGKVEEIDLASAERRRDSTYDGQSQRVDV